MNIFQIKDLDKIYLISHKANCFYIYKWYDILSEENVQSESRYNFYKCHI